MATVVSVNISQKKGERKTAVDSAAISPGHGIVSDAHAGPGHRQVSLLGVESIRKMQALGLEVGPGDFAENLTTEGIDLVSLPLGTRVRIGATVEVEVTQIGKECHDRCAIYYQAGDCVMPREGIFVKVLEGGEVRAGDMIRLIEKGRG
ncbi:MAG: MOSC domain-containing protein [bacterium]|nr:MOSC domain-containing protein [bacterium]